MSSCQQASHNDSRLAILSEQAWFCRLLVLLPAPLLCLDTDGGLVPTVELRIERSMESC